MIWGFGVEMAVEMIYKFTECLHFAWANQRKNLLDFDSDLDNILQLMIFLFCSISLEK